MLLYRSKRMIITDRVVAIREPWPAHYRVDDLSFPRVVEHGAGSAGATAGRSAAALAAVLFGYWAVRSTAWPQTFVAVVALVSSVVGCACIRPAPRRRELWVLHRQSMDVRIYHSTDSREFGHVRRAMTRAFESRRARHAEHGGWWELAS